MTDALCLELKFQKQYLKNEPIKSIYFGGGTPSLLPEAQIKQILEVIHKEYQVGNDLEITLEANPDDLDKAKLKSFSKAGVNRLSIGIQSFHEEVLRFLNRAHNAVQSQQCLDDARDVGYSNISIDLIYAIPNRDHSQWAQDLAEALKQQPEHISSYCLTIEPKTAFGNWLKKGTMPAIDEEFSATQFEILTKTLSDAGYEQYEVSNYCLPGHYSKHNSGYWKQEKYLGIGPSAHSYNGVNRQFNVSNNIKYMKSINDAVIPCEQDILNDNDRINEYLLTTLRTKWGASLDKIRMEMGYDLKTDQHQYLQQLLDEKYAIIEAGHLKLTNRGFLLADKISSDLFKI